MRTRPNHKPRSSRLLPAAGIATLAALTLAACGNSGDSASTDGGSEPQAGASAPAGPPGGQRPAASGLIAAVDGSTMQVQNQQSGQVAVRWTDTTKFSHTVTVKVSSIKAGDCVTAIAPSGTDQSATSFTATTVTVSESTNGECGRGGMGGPGGANGNRPSDIPSGFPSGAPGAPGGGAGNFGGIASGEVVSVSGSAVVIDAQSFDPNSGSTTPTTVHKTITVSSDTKVTGQASTTSESVAVGKCATAQGTADDTGTVTATSVSITDAANGQCMGGFGGFNGNR